MPQAEPNATPLLVAATTERTAAATIVRPTLASKNAKQLEATCAGGERRSALLRQKTKAVKAANTGRRQKAKVQKSQQLRRNLLLVDVPSRCSGAALTGPLAKMMKKAQIALCCRPVLMPQAEPNATPLLVAATTERTAAATIVRPTLASKNAKQLEATCAGGERRSALLRQKTKAVKAANTGRRQKAKVRKSQRRPLPQQ